VLVASGLLTKRISKKVTIFMPENGFISLNPPLTLRRIGSLSTRTSHPYFISSMQNILDKVGLAVNIENPYKYCTKGEMLRDCRNQQVLQQIIDLTISCGKWKRINLQCGACVPCILRRSAYNAAKIPDKTQYKYEDLKKAQHNDDILSLRTAILKSTSANMKGWLLRSAPLSPDPTTRKFYVDVFERGLHEVEGFFSKEF
jgi:hypothetical protein